MLDHIMMEFKSFLEQNVEKVILVLSHSEHKEELLNAWLQVNWEILVERVTCANHEFLAVYGEGSDIYGSSSRVSFPDALPTHAIVIRNKEGRELIDIFTGKSLVLPVDFLGFFNTDGYYYKLNSELNCVLCSNNVGEYVALKFEDISFVKLQL